MTSSDVASVGAIKEKLPAEVDYWHIKMTISVLQVSTDYKRPNDKFPGNNKLPSNTHMAYKKTTHDTKRQLPSWSSAMKKSSKKSKKFF